jgi:transketolase
MRRTALDMVYELAKRDPRVVFIGSDLGAGALDRMKAEMPERFFMEGVSEANVIGMAAGLAMDGFVPYVNTIATFLTRRCYEQVAVDLCLHQLPVRLIANGGGVVYAPLGPTHIAIEDLAIMRALPGMTVVAPTDADEMRRLIPATLEQPGPVYIRLAKGGDPVVSREADGFEIGKPILLREPGQVLLLATGVMVNRAITAAEELAPGLDCGVLNVHTLKPLDAERILALCRGVDLVVTVEEHTRIGGLGSAVAEVLVELGSAMPEFRSLGIPDVFTEKYGSQDEVLEFYGLQPHQIAAAVRRALGRDAA